jgi:hypothetical protein
MSKKTYVKKSQFSPLSNMVFGSFNHTRTQTHASLNTKVNKCPYNAHCASCQSNACSDLIIVQSTTY